MKTAILITGHMRTFARVIRTQQWHVYRHFPDADFYVSTVRDQDTGSIDELRKLYPKARIEVDVVDAQPELPIPVPPVAEDWTVGRMYGHEPYAISVHPQAILRQLWQLNRAWEYFDNTGSGDYDCIVRVRPDLWFRSFEPPPMMEMQIERYGEKPVLSCVGDYNALTPWWGRFGGVNDRFAVLGPKAAEAYFRTYANMPTLLNLGCPLHPESLVKASMSLKSCLVEDTLLAEFCKLYGNENPQLAGQFRNPEITEIDMAHLAAKGRP